MAKARRPSRPQKKKQKSGFVRTLVRWVGRLILAFVVLSLGFTVLFKYVPVPITLSMLLDRQVWAHGGPTKTWVPLERIDRNMVRAVIAAEDSRFCSHNGFDGRAIEQALQRNARGGRLRGGSTISQQTAKNVFLWQGTGWTRYARKGLEPWFTVLIEQIWGKRRIMEVYLNVAETGIGTYGVEAGAQRYFGHSAEHLTPMEAARLAAILPLPKEREVNDASGFTRRYGNTIAARIGVVKRDGLDACVFPER